MVSKNAGSREGSDDLDAFGGIGVVSDHVAQAVELFAAIPAGIG
jgi:hypothetical protein